MSIVLLSQLLDGPPGRAVLDLNIHWSYSVASGGVAPVCSSCVVSLPGKAPGKSAEMPSFAMR